MSDKFNNKYRIPTNRLQGFDYGSNAFYFVTICTKNKEHYFGEIISNSVETYNNASSLINNVKPHNDVAHINNNVETDNYPSFNNNNYFQNMNNTHNSASLRATQIGKIAWKYWMEIPNHYPFVMLDEFVVMPNHVHGILYLNQTNKTDWTPNKFGPQSNNLGAIIRAYKSSVKRYANQNNIEFEWQSRYHDRIIRDDNEYYAVKNYIINNPDNWRLDELY